MRIAYPLEIQKSHFKGAITGLRIIRGQAESKQLKAIINPGNRPAISLRQIAAPRFWQPKEPAVAIVGDDAASSDSFQTEDHYPHDLLKCTYIEGLSTDALLGNDKPASLKVIRSLRKTLDHIQQSRPDAFGYFISDGTSWNPLFAEWEVALYPLAISNLHNGKSSQYNPEFIYQGYQLPRESNELELRPEQCPLAQAASFLGGRSLISPNVSAAMNVRLDEFIKSNKGNVPKEFLDIQKKLSATNAQMLTFPLSGINAAMLQKQQVMQLPADDPLAFAEYAEFAQRVKKAVGQQRTTAPDPALDFHPIQSGALELRRLRLIDNFGQSREQSVNKIERTERLEVAQHDNLVSLPVRLSQSARLEFRLLQAAEKIKDASEHHNGSPVCGWLTVNDLDELIMVHDAKGNPLGTLNADSDLIWQPAPGMERPFAPAMFSNPTLRKVIEWLIRQGDKFIDLFAHTLENSLDTIHPENFGADEWTLMSGRPLAIVQVKVELLLKGLPANDQGYGAFHRNLHSGIRDSAGYENVKFPVRIGDHRQVNDGLVGYWREDKEERLSKQFHAPNANAVEMAQQETGSTSKTENKIIGATEPPLIPLSIRQPAQILTLLIDPRGHLQATSGILPQKSITLPEQFYSEALAKMRPIFLTAPVLTPSDKLTLPLPRHHGLHWDWLERRREQWERTDQQAISEPAAASGASSAKQEIREGWLELNPNKQDNENN